MLLKLVFISRMRACAGTRCCCGRRVTPLADSQIDIKTYYIRAYEKDWSETLISTRYPQDANAVFTRDTFTRGKLTFLLHCVTFSVVK